MFVMLLTITSRVLGLVREMAIKYVYGTDMKTDAFSLAYNIPEMIRTLIISGVLGAIFIPIFADFKEKRSFEEAKKVSTEIFSFTIIVSVSVCILGMIFAPQIIRFMEIISFRKVDEETFNLAVSLTRVMFPMLIFVSLSGLMQGILNSVHHFKTPAVAPILFNLTIILTILGFWYSNPESFDNIYVLSYSVVAGLFLQAMVQLPALKSFGFTLLKVPNLKHEAFVKFWELAPAAMVGYATMIINSFVDKAIAFPLAEGSLTALSRGLRVQQLPYSVFGITIVTVLFPSIAQHISAGRFDELKKAINRGVRMIAFTVLPSSVFFMALSQIIVNLLFGYGKDAVNPDSILWTSDALKFYTFGIFPAISLHFISRIFFSFHDTKTPLKAGLLMVFINYGLDQYFATSLGVKGLALATSIVSFLNCVILIYFLKPRVPHIWASFFNRHLLKILVACIAQYAVLRVMRTQLLQIMPETSATQSLIIIGAGIVVTLIVFGGLVFALRCGEIGMIKDYVFKRKIK